jgi:hypothetical protein
MTEDRRIYYYLGSRDALATLCAAIRLHGLVVGTRSIVEQLRGFNPENPHIEAVLKILDECEAKDAKD